MFPTSCFFQPDLDTNLNNDSSINTSFVKPTMHFCCRDRFRSGLIQLCNLYTCDMEFIFSAILTTVFLSLSEISSVIMFDMLNTKNFE